MVAPKGNAAGGTPADYTTGFDHDPAGHTVAVTDPEGGVSKRQFGTGGELVWEEDPEGNRTSYSYDAAGQLVEVERPDTTTLGFEYWGDGQLKSRVDAADASTTYAYDPAGRVAAVTDPLGRTTTHGYDLEGRRVWEQAPGGDCEASPVVSCTEFSYDELDQLVGVSHSDDGAVATPDVVDIAYDGVGRRVSMTDGTGTSSWEWSPFRELVSTTAGNGDVVSYTYDRRGLQTSVTYPGDKTVTRSFDDAGRFVGVSDWLGGMGGFSYDENSNVTGIAYPSGTGNVDTFSFDRADRLSGVTYAKGVASLGSIAYGRDDNGRVTSGDWTGLPGVDESYGYSPLDQLEQVNAAVLDYDVADNLVLRVDGASQAFDAANQLCWSSPSGASGTCGTAPPDAITYDYDDSGNRTAEHLPSGLSRELTYDAANRLVAAEVPAGDGAQGQYHPLSSARVADTRNGTGICVPSPCARPTSGNKTITIDVAGHAGVPVGADAVSLNVKAANPVGGGYLTVYPADQSRPTASNVNYGTATVGNAAVTKLSADGKIKVYTSNVADVVVDVEGWYAAPDSDAGDAFHPLTTPGRALDTRAATRTGDCSPGSCSRLSAGSTLTLDIAGQVDVPDEDVTAAIVNVTAVNPSATGFTRVYPSGESVPNSSNLNYVSGDVIAQMVVAKLGTDGKIKIYSSAATDLLVDVQGYFTDVDLEGGASFNPISPTRLYDTRNSTYAANCVAASPPPCDRVLNGETVTLDINGVGGLPASGIEAVALNVAAVNGTTGGSGYLQTYPADVAAPATSSLNFQNGETIANAVTTRVDANGQFTIKVGSGGADVVIDVQGWYSATTETWTYAYDGDGYRTQRSAPDGTVTGFTWDRSDPVPKLLTQTSDGGERTYLIYGPGGHPYAQITGTEVIYYHRDQLGSTRLLTDASGDPVGTYTYDAYGALTDSTGTAAPLLGYAGEYTDHETGYTYLRARHYDPTTGQFLTRDPLEQQTWEPYAYAANNPVTNTDPLGLFCVGSLCTEDIGDGLAAVGGAISDAWDYGYEVVTDNVDDAWDFTYRNRGTIATVGAITTCLVPAIGIAGCAYAAGGAFVARASKRIEDRGFRDSLGANLADGALTYLTLGLSGAFESAGQGLSPGLNYLGRLVPAGYDATSFFMWLDELC